MIGPTMGSPSRIDLRVWESCLSWIAVEPIRHGQGSDIGGYVDIVTDLMCPLHSSANLGYDLDHLHA